MHFLPAGMSGSCASFGTTAKERLDIVLAKEPVSSGQNALARDLSVAELAESCLRANAYLALKDISCCHEQGTLVLRGRLPTYYLKQVASAVVSGVPGVQRVVNLIDVTAGLANP
jgi:osmotically-inducible protein OsmY